MNLLYKILYAECLVGFLYFCFFLIVKPRETFYIMLFKKGRNKFDNIFFGIFIWLFFFLFCGFILLTVRIIIKFIL